MVSGTNSVGRSVSHYRLERKIGAGGMGEVYLATDVALGRRAAVKLLPESYTAALRDRLFREAWASARLQHPAIATFYEAGEAEGVAFVAMEYVQGRTLREELDSGPAAFGRGITLICGILEALTHAHAAQILHRDIKPANIMCTEDGGAKLLDFGLAKHTFITHVEPDEAGQVVLGESDISTDTETLVVQRDSLPRLEDTADDLTQAGTVLGTLGYMSPEQLRGKAVDPRTDIFALGAVLYETLSGRPAFPGVTTRERVDAVLRKDPPPLEVGERSAAVNAIVARALSKDVANRFATATEFLSELRSLYDEQTDAALPSSVAVLEFEDQSTDEGLEWLTSGLPDVVSARLQDAHKISLVPRPKIAAARKTVAGTPAELGLHLGCRWIIYGEFAGNREDLRVAASLVEVPVARTCMTADARGTLGTIFEMQESIVGKLIPHLAPDASEDNRPSGTPSVDAFECYVRGRRELFQYEKSAFDRAFELFTRAVELNPGYALALSSLAQLAGLRFIFSHDLRTLDSAIDYAQRAIQADPQLADPRVWLAYARAQLVFGKVDAGHHVDEARSLLAEASRLLTEAQKLEPKHPMAAYFAAGFAQIECRFAADAEERRAIRTRALELYQRALQVTPHSCWSWLGIGWVHLDLGNEVEARWCLEKAVELEPHVTPPTAGVAVFLGEGLRRIGELELARQTSLKGLDAVERSDHMYRDTFRGVGLCGLGRTSLQLDDIDAARTAFRQAVLHLEGRSKARVGGQLLVQALAGLARCGEGPEPFEEAATLFESRQGYDFGWMWWGWDEITLLELTHAALALELTDRAREYRKAALDAGSVEAETVAHFDTT